MEKTKDMQQEMKSMN